MGSKNFHEEVVRLGKLEHRLELAGDVAGSKRVWMRIRNMQARCRHSRTLTEAVRKNGRNIKKGDLFTWCKDCLKVLKP